MECTLAKTSTLFEIYIWRSKAGNLTGPGTLCISLQISLEPLHSRCIKILCKSYLQTLEVLSPFFSSPLCRNCLVLVTLSYTICILQTRQNYLPIKECILEDVARDLRYHFFRYRYDTDTKQV